MQPQAYRVTFEPGREDTVVYKRKTLISKDEEFFKDIAISANYKKNVAQRVEVVGHNGGEVGSLNNNNMIINEQQQNIEDVKMAE